MRQSYTRERMDESAQRWLDEQEFECIVCGEPVRHGDAAQFVDEDGKWAGEAHEECVR